uniref:Uncharacterized protein n=1 Tax=Glossina austeni TaxID=7395 RepID=A0A1A9V6L5_GLOAU
MPSGVITPVLRQCSHTLDSSDSLRGYRLHLGDHYRRKFLKLEKHRADTGASRNGWNDYSDEFWICHTPEYSCVTEFSLTAISRAPGVVQNKFDEQNWLHNNTKKYIKLEIER